MGSLTGPVLCVYTITRGRRSGTARPRGREGARRARRVGQRRRRRRLARALGGRYVPRGTGLSRTRSRCPAPPAPQHRQPRTHTHTHTARAHAHATRRTCVPRGPSGAPPLPLPPSPSPSPSAPPPPALALRLPPCGRPASDSTADQSIPSFLSFRGASDGRIFVECQSYHHLSDGGLPSLCPEKMELIRFEIRIGSYPNGA